MFRYGIVLTDPEIGKQGDIDSATVILVTTSGRQCVILELSSRNLWL